MGYVGNQQTEGFSQVPAKQDLTGATGTSLTLSHAVASAEGIDLFINNVRQEPTTAYSVGADGVTVTLTGSVVAADDIYVVYNSLALQTTVPPDASVSTAKIIDGSVTKAKIGTTELDLATIKDSTGTTTAMTIDSSGRVFKPATPAFHAYADDGVYQTTTPIPFDNTTINIGNAFDTTNYKYVVPVTGNYFISVHLGIVRDDVSGGESLNVQLLKGTTRIQRGYFEEVSSTGYGTVSFSAIHALNAGDELTVTTGGGADYSAAAADAIFSGYLIG